MILLKLHYKHIHKVKFYPSGENFTEALLVMLVTNITSVLNDAIFYGSLKKAKHGANNASNDGHCPPLFK